MYKFVKKVKFEKKDLSKLSTSKWTKKVEKTMFSKSFPHYPHKKPKKWWIIRGK